MLGLLAWCFACSGPSATNLFDSPSTSSQVATGGASAGASNREPLAGGGALSGGAAPVDADPDAGDGGEAGGLAPSSGGERESSAGATAQGGFAGTGGMGGMGGMGGIGGIGTAGIGGVAGTAGVAATAGSAGGSGHPIVQLHGTASASSSESDPTPGGGFHPARDANDGDETNTRWCAATHDVPVWWQLDLGAAHPLSRVEIVWEYPGQALGYVYGYTVGVSDDAAEFADPPVIDQRANVSTDKTQIAQFPSATTGRYVRITVTSLPPDSNDSPPFETWASMYEVRVFGQ